MAFEQYVTDRCHVVRRRGDISNQRVSDRVGIAVWEKMETSHTHQTSHHTSHIAHRTAYHTSHVTRCSWHMPVPMPLPASQSSGKQCGSFCTCRVHECERQINITQRACASSSYPMLIECVTCKREAAAHLPTMQATTSSSFIFLIPICTQPAWQLPVVRIIRGSQYGETDRVGHDADVVIACE